jgi:hypothetical protein
MIWSPDSLYAKFLPGHAGIANAVANAVAKITHPRIDPIILALDKFESV